MDARKSAQTTLDVPARTVFDISTIIFLVLAVVIFLRLRSVLGRRTGHERPPMDYPASGAAGGNDKVVNLPTSGRPAGETTGIGGKPDDIDEEAWKDFAKPGPVLSEGLLAIRNVDRAFEPREFLQGAEAAYEMIVTAFADGDRRMLRSLLSPDVFDGFIAAISDREARGERIESRFIGISAADIQDAELKGSVAHVTVKFRSQLVSATLSKDGDVVEGDTQTVSDVTDVWTFARDTNSRDPNWQLVATEAGD